MSRTKRPSDVSAEPSPQFVEPGPLPPVSPSAYDVSAYRHNAVPAWLAPILQGITLVILVGFAFWFGALGKTVEQTAKTVEELRAAQDQISNRLTSVETELRGVNNRLTSVETRVGSMDNRLTVIETKLDSVDKKRVKP